LESFKETSGNILFEVPLTRLRFTRIEGTQLAALSTANIVLDRLIEAFDLLKVYGVTNKDEARDILKRRIKAQMKSGLLTISIEDRDPERALKLASRCIEEMENLLKDLLKREALKKRQIYETYLEKLKSDFLNTKEELQNFKGSKDNEYFAKLKNFEAKKRAYEVFLKFYEQAKYEEEIPQVVLQVVDPPVMPQKKVKPKRSLIIAVSLILGIFVGIFTAFVLESYEKKKSLSS